MMKPNKTEALADGEIIDLFWQRQESAIVKVQEKYGRLLFSLAKNVLGEDEDAEECRNDTYIALWNSIPPKRPRSLRAYAAEIARRIAINKYYERNAKKRVPSNLTVSMEECEELFLPEDIVINVLESKELGRIINEFVRSLPPKRRYIFMSRFYMSESVGVIARELRKTESAVYKELERTRKELKNYLEEKGVNV